MFSFNWLLVQSVKDTEFLYKMDSFLMEVVMTSVMCNSNDSFSRTSSIILSCGIAQMITHKTCIDSEVVQHVLQSTDIGLELYDLKWQWTQKINYVKAYFTNLNYTSISLPEISSWILVLVWSKRGNPVVCGVLVSLLLCFLQWAVVFLPGSPDRELEYSNWHWIPELGVSNHFLLKHKK
jgi:hypothetical protein